MFSKAVAIQKMGKKIFAHLKIHSKLTYCCCSSMSTCFLLLIYDFQVQAQFVVLFDNKSLLMKHHCLIFVIFVDRMIISITSVVLLLRSLISVIYINHRMSIHLNV